MPNPSPHCFYPIQVYLSALATSKPCRPCPPRSPPCFERALWRDTCPCALPHPGRQRCGLECECWCYCGCCWPQQGGTQPDCIFIPTSQLMPDHYGAPAPVLEEVTAASLELDWLAAAMRVKVSVGCGWVGRRGWAGEGGRGDWAGQGRPNLNERTRATRGRKSTSSTCCHPPSALLTHAGRGRGEGRAPLPDPRRA